MIINIESTSKEISFRDLIEGEYFIWEGLVYIKTLDESYESNCNAVCLNDGSTEVLNLNEQVTPVTVYLQIVK